MVLEESVLVLRKYILKSLETIGYPRALNLKCIRKKKRNVCVSIHTYTKRENGKANVIVCSRGKGTK